MRKLLITAFLIGALFAFTAPASAGYGLRSNCDKAYERLESLQNHLLVQTRLSDYETACNDAATNFMHPEEFFRLAEEKAEAISSSCPAYSR